MLTFFLSYVTYLLSLLSVSVLSVMNFTVTVLRFIIFGAFRRIKVCSSNKAKQHRYLNYNYLLARRGRYRSRIRKRIYTNIIRISLDYESKACYRQRFLSVRSRVGFHRFARATRRRSHLRIATASSIEVRFSML